MFFKKIPVYGTQIPFPAKDGLFFLQELLFPAHKFFFLQKTACIFCRSS